jgi:hypothetical protein
MQNLQWALNVCISYNHGAIPGVPSTAAKLLDVRYYTLLPSCLLHLVLFYKKMAVDAGRRLRPGDVGRHSRVQMPVFVGMRQIQHGIVAPCLISKVRCDSHNSWVRLLRGRSPGRAGWCGAAASARGCPSPRGRLRGGRARSAGCYPRAVTNPQSIIQRKLISITQRRGAGPASRRAAAPAWPARSRAAAAGSRPAARCPGAPGAGRTRRTGCA